MLITSAISIFFSFKSVAFLLTGVIFGILVGATPGLSPAMGVALLVPLSYGMEPEIAFILFVSCYQASNYGGSITAIALNAPGTASAVVTAIDGYEFTKKGRSKEALTYAVLASTIGGLIATLILILSTKVIADYALSFGPAEYFSLALLGLATVIAFEKNYKLKAFISVLLGLLLSTVGLDSMTGDERLTFGLIELFDGINFIPALIGLFALSEVLEQINSNRVIDSINKSVKLEILSFAETSRKFISKYICIIRSSIIGTLIGVVPGAGATVASFLSYGANKKDKNDNFDPSGIISSEVANSSSVGGALVPLLALGIPGSATDAVLLGALTLHGLTAGPELFTSNPILISSVYLSLLFANILILFFGLLGNKLWLKILTIKKEYVFFFVIPICLLGSYLARSSIFDIYVCIAFGIIGFFLKRINIKPAAIILGLVLGKLLEENFRRTLTMGGFEMFYLKPISLLFLILTVICFIPFLKSPKSSCK